MGKVAVPKQFFFNAAKRDYNNPLRAYIREFLQNSRDAGAKKIEFSLEKVGQVLRFVCADDGRGMSQEVVESKLMALGESTKSEAGGETGGFGVAKILIFFAQVAYKIQSHSIEVTGMGDDYRVYATKSLYPGTEASVLLDKDLFGENVEHILGVWREELGKSDLPGVTVTLGGERQKCSRKVGKLYQDLGWCVIYQRRVKETRYTGFVRVNGLHMFDVRLVSGGTQREVIVELKSYSTECLTSNRDGLQLEKHIELANVLENMESVIDPSRRTTLFCFADAQNLDVRKMSPTCEGGTPSSPMPLSPVHLDSKVQNRDLTKNPTGIQGEPNSSNDFYIQIHGGEKIPAGWKPGKLSPGRNALKVIWNVICRRVASAAGFGERKFETGFAIDVRKDGEPFELGLFLESGGRSLILLSPEPFLEFAKGRSETEVILRLVTIAIHEVTHFSGILNHSNAFIIRELEIRAAVYGEILDFINLAPEWYNRIFPKQIPASRVKGEKTRTFHEDRQLSLFP